MARQSGNGDINLQVQQLALTNSLNLAAVMELLEEKGILTQVQVIERMKVIRDRKKPS